MIVSLIAFRQSSFSSPQVRLRFATSDGNSVREVLREIRRIMCIRLGTGAEGGRAGGPEGGRGVEDVTTDSGISSLLLEAGVTGDGERLVNV